MGSEPFIPATAEGADAERDLLCAVRDLVRADQEMRRAMGRRLALGASDLRALRPVMAHERSGSPTTPHEIARDLDITSGCVPPLRPYRRRPGPRSSRS